MKISTRIALAALLSCGVSGAALVAPAIAKEKAPAGPQLTPAVRTALVAAQTALGTKDTATADAQLTTADAAAKTDDDKYMIASLRLQSVQARLQAQQAANPGAPLDQTALAGPIDALLASPKTPAENKAKLAAVRGKLAFQSKQYPVAIQYLTQAQQLGYKPATADDDIGLLLVQAKMNGGDVKTGLADLDSYVRQQQAAGQKAPEEYYRFAVSKANGAKLRPETLSWMNRWIAAYPTGKNWRDVLYIYGIQQNAIVTLDKSQKLDLFRLMRASGSLADQYDYTEYAQYCRDRGLPAEAIAVLQEGMANGKIPAGNGSAKLLMSESQTIQKNEAPLATQESKARAAATGTLAASVGDVYLSSKQYAKAADLYRAALTKGGVNADEVNTHLGMALAQGGDKAGAQAAFGAVKASPRTDIAAFWQTWSSNAAPAA